MYGSNVDTSNAQKNSGVTCTVETCGYHGDGNSCHASNIRVGTDYATSKDETFCGTFISK